MLKIRLAKGIGFCSGVRRAMNIVEKTLNRYKGKVYSYGPIIHNPLVVLRLEKKNLLTVNSLDELEDSSVVILPSHGSRLSILNIARKKKLKLIDVTCPYVSSVHKICKSLYKKKLKVVIIGDKTHPEVKALIDLAPNYCIIKNSNEIKENDFSSKKIGIISQTTQERTEFFKIVASILEKNHNVREVHIFNTICQDTSNRQEEVKKLARVVDTLLVIGSHISANTKRLFRLGRKINRRTFLIEDESPDLDKILKNSFVIGIISGASTPEWLVKAVVKRISEFETYGTQ